MNRQDIPKYYKRRSSGDYGWRGEGDNRRDQPTCVRPSPVATAYALLSGEDDIRDVLILPLASVRRRTSVDDANDVCLWHMPPLRADDWLLICRSSVFVTWRGQTEEGEAIWYYVIC